MTDCYKTEKECFRNKNIQIDKYEKLKKRIRKDIKKYRTLAEITKNEDYKLAYEMIADYLDEIEKE